MIRSEEEIEHEEAAWERIYRLDDRLDAVVRWAAKQGYNPWEVSRALGHQLGSVALASPRRVRPGMLADSAYFADKASKNFWHSKLAGIRRQFGRRARAFES